MEGVIFTGVPSKDELNASKGIPSVERMNKGKVACIECVQEIPCNPCEGICPTGAIIIGENITNLPQLIEEKCTGCGLCVANCPGLAITIINNGYSEEEASIDFPFEYLPLPDVGDEVLAVSRDGSVVCKGKILAVKKVKAYDGTTVVSMSVPKSHLREVASMKRLSRKS